MSNFFATPWTVACQAPLSMGFPRQEYWRWLPFPSPGDLLHQWSNPCLLLGRQILYHWATWEAQFCISVQFSCLVVSDSFRPHGLQHTRLPCTSPTPRAYSNSCPSSWWCHPTISSPILPFSSHLQSSIRVFSDKSVLPIRWPKHWSFSFSISPFSEYSGLISFGIDWLALHTVQGTLKSLLQHHSSKPSILQHSAFFIVQLSHPYMTTGKTIALTIWTFVGKVSLCFLICCLGWS